MVSLLHAVEFRDAWLLSTAMAAIPVYALARRAGGRLTFSSLAVLPAARHSVRAALAWLPPALLALATALLAVALAGPRTAKTGGEIAREGIAIMMVVDTSGSMAALDLSTKDRERTRLDAVKDVFAEFVRGGEGMPGRPNDAIGLVSFAAFADTRCPLTLDHDSLLFIADKLEIVTQRGEDGTAIGDGLGLAVERLRESPAKSRVAILLTDGVQNAGEESPQAAAELAKTVGVKAYTVGAGTNGMAPIRVPDPFTGEMVLRPVPVEIDEDMLKEVAERTGGVYFRATDGNGLRRVYQEIDRLERTRLIEQRYQEYTEYYPWVTSAAAVVAALAWLLGATWLRRLP
jgi:Ca-activated chloride channel family protein